MGNARGSSDCKTAWQEWQRCRDLKRVPIPGVFRRRKSTRGRTPPGAGMDHRYSAASVTASVVPNFLGKGAYAAASTEGIAANITIMK